MSKTLTKMSIPFTFRSILFLLFFLLGSHVIAQDTLQEVIFPSPKQANVKIGVNSSFGIANGRTLAGMWHKANFSAGTSLQLGVRVANNLWINAGASLDFHRYRSASFVHSGSYYHIYGFYQGQSVGWWNDFEDDFERFTERNSRYISFPVSVEYTSPQKIGWYAEAGASYGWSFYDEEINRRKDTKEVISTYNQPLTKIKTPYSDWSLFMNLSGGFQIRKGQSIYQFGLRYDHILANFGGDIKERGIHALRFEIGFQHEIKGIRIRRVIAKAYDDRLNRKNYIYTELLGNVHLMHSFNYERSFFIKEKTRWNGRLGVAMLPGAQSDKWVSILIFGGSFISGKIHAIEYGLNVANFNEPKYSGANHNEFFLIPTLGYRFEPKNRLFFRLSYTPQIFIEAPSYNGQSFLSMAGLSIGTHF